MKQYKGYYIDKMIFNNEKEIDDFIKKETIGKLKMLTEEMFKCHGADKYAVSTMMIPYEERLINEYDFTPEEIELMEIEFMKEVA